MKLHDPRRTSSFCAFLLASGVACADPTFHFDIRSTTLDAALKEFAAQSGLQIAYFTKIAEGRKAPAVSGTLTAEEALRALLNASGLTFERIDDGTVVIRTQTTGARDVDSGESHYSLRLARADAQQTDSGGPRPSSTVPDPNIVSEVLVTGSHIRGVENGTVPVTTYDREYIDRSGFSNIMQFVESLPLQFKGGNAGSTEASPYGGAASYGQNLTRGTGFNLHGLGSVSTLTLINGRRLAPSAQGQFVDVSTIPLAAVERVEILTDGASAIYGADAVAGVVNIILRKDFEGAETGLEYGSDFDNALEQRRVSQLLGTTWSSGTVVAVGEYYTRSELDVLERDFLVEAGAQGPTYVLPERDATNLVVSLNQDLPAGFDLSSTLLYSYEEVVSVDGSDGTSLFSQTPITNKWSAGLGVGYTPFADWRVALDGTLSRIDTATDFTVVDIETQEPILLVTDYNDKYDTWSVDLKGDGPLFDLPGGTVRLAIGGSYREDDVRSTRVRVLPATGFEVRAIDSRNITSVFGELYVPIVGERQNFSWARRIEMSIAGRYDEYSDFGSTTNPKFGIVWTPFDGLDLRASVSSSFRAPTVAEKAIGARGQQISTEEFEAPDGSGLIPAFTLSGSAPLTAEESDNKAFGFTFRPAAVSGAELSVNYFDIDYTNRIAFPPFDLGLLGQPDVYGNLIAGIADDAAAQAYLDSLIAQDWFYIDWVGSGTAGVRYVVDLRQKNAARAQISGFDITARYTFTLGPDTFDVNLSATHLKEILTSLTRDTATIDEVDTYNQPLDWRGRAMLTWTRGGLNVTGALNYADNYINNSFVVDERIGSWTTVDANLSYDFSGRTQSTLLDGTRLSFSASNLFDEDPPRAGSPLFPLGFDVFNADALGRFVTARLTRRW
jgi:iron complex outermembrane recepter protein